MAQLQLLRAADNEQERIIRRMTPSPKNDWLGVGTVIAWLKAIWMRM